MEMDGNTKNMALTGMAALCLILGILGALGNTWLVPTGEDAEAMEEMDMETGMSLRSVWTTMDVGDADACDMATGGMIGTIGMWAGILCALVLTLSLALPMAGVDAMDQLPDIAKKIATWGAGAAMLVGMLGWYMMIPESDSETGLGMSGWLAGAAMTIGLGAAAMDQFVESTE